MTEAVEGGGVGTKRGAGVEGTTGTIGATTEGMVPAVVVVVSFTIAAGIVVVDSIVVALNSLSFFFLGDECWVVVATIVAC